jgi:putative inorganic carbon (hco3(-)) transporter
VGTGLGHYIPLVAYAGFWVMFLVSLAGRPQYGLFYMLPFIPYRTMRDRFEVYPMGSNMLTIMVLAVIVGALLKHKRLPPSKLFLTWLLFGLYLYMSMWIGTAISNAPMPLWLGDANFVTWKDYMMLPLLLVATALVVEDRRAVKITILLAGFSLLLVDRSSLLESLSHSWVTFDESKRAAGPIEMGSNELAAYLAQFAMFFWGFAHFMKRFKVKLIAYGLVALTIVTTLYTFSRGAYLALLVGVLVLALVKDRKLLLLLGVVLLTWQSIVPTAVTQRVTMTRDANGQLEMSAQERIDLWTQSRDLFFSSPLVGRGYATFQFGEHTANLKDTHNWYVKVLVETGVIGGIFALAILGQMFAAGFMLFRKATDPLYQGLGLGLLVAVTSCAIANCFGDRWTYIEINGILWVLVGATLRARELSRQTPEQELAQPAAPSSPLPAHLGWSYQ